jgi:lysophospholipase L1-like esterase
MGADRTRTERARRPLGGAVVLALVLSVALGGARAQAAPTPPAAKLHVTFVGDSISASFEYVASAKRSLSRGWNVTYDLRVCRRLVSTSCTFQGQTPSTALQAVTALGRSLGDVLIVNVGYNEGSYGYRDGMRRVLRAAFAQGARGVVWVTLREGNSVYRPTNAAIRKEAQRWQDVEVADWEAYSRGKAWFREDGLHLNTAGAQALARLLRASVQSVA